MLHSKTISSLAFAMALVGVVGNSKAATFTDPGTFATSTWTESLFGGGSVTDTRETTGGNPDAFLRLGTVPSGGTVIYGAYINSAATWDPGAQGAIDTISMMLDERIFDHHPCCTDGQAFGIALMQGGLIFRNNVNSLTGIDLDWVTRSILDIGASQFVELNSDGTSSASSNPDFSAAGGLISFGFTVANSGSAAISGSVAGYDNWELTVNPVTATVPLPATLPLVGTGMAMLGFMGWRRKRAA